MFCSVQISCAQTKEAGFDLMLSTLLSNSVETINSEQMKESLNTSSIYVLDTREEKEYAVSHIKGALNVGYDQFKKSSVKDIPKDAEVIVYCSVGFRSEKIGEKLEKMGYQNVKNLKGGIFDWKNNGNEVVDQNDEKTEKVHTYNREWSIWLENGEKIYD
jgi:rhodanese-related sulfurtransferase